MNDLEKKIKEAFKENEISLNSEQILNQTNFVPTNKIERTFKVLSPILFAISFLFCFSIGMIAPLLSEVEQRMVDRLSDHRYASLMTSAYITYNNEVPQDTNYDSKDKILKIFDYVSLQSFVDFRKDSIETNYKFMDKGEMREGKPYHHSTNLQVPLLNYELDVLVEKEIDNKYNAKLIDKRVNKAILDAIISTNKNGKQAELSVDFEPMNLSITNQRSFKVYENKNKLCFKIFENNYKKCSFEIESKFSEQKITFYNEEDNFIKYIINKENKEEVNIFQVKYITANENGTFTYMMDENDPTSFKYY